MKKLFIATLIVYLAVGCSTSSTGKYSQSHIDRPYVLPDDVASIEFGSVFKEIKTFDVSEDKVSSIDEDSTNGSLPTLIFEQGIGKSMSWIYPLGLKWDMFSNANHTFGARFASFIIFSTYSLDYWYRVNKSISFRPYLQNEKLNTYYFKENRDLFGAEVIYQMTDKVALTLNYGRGSYEGHSPFLDDVFEDISGNDESNIKQTGDITRFTAGSIYSLSQYWDFRGDISIETIKYEDFSNKASVLDVSFVHFY